MLLLAGCEHLLCIELGGLFDQRGGGFGLGSRGRDAQDVGRIGGVGAACNGSLGLQGLGGGGGIVRLSRGGCAVCGGVCGGVRGSVGDGAHEAVARVVSSDVVCFQRRRGREFAEERMVASGCGEAGLRLERCILAHDGNADGCRADGCVFVGTAALPQGALGGIVGVRM